MSVIKCEYPYSLKIGLYRGFSWNKQVNIYDGGTLVDLSADDFTLTVKNAVTGETILVLTLSNGLTTPATGTLNIEFTAVQTENLPKDKLEYKLKWERSNGEVIPLFADFLDVKG